MKDVSYKKLLRTLMLATFILTNINGWSNSLPDDSSTGNKQITLGQRITSMATLMRDY